jgi:hypothetical protein
MKLWKNIIRVWFTLASLASFFAGWIALAHAPKPNQFDPSDLPALPKLEPVPSIDQMMFSRQSVNILRSNQRVVVLRSGGS